jgi:hypothetical protein
MRAQPFVLRFRLATPVCLNHPWLHLDGVLAHLMHQRLLGRDYYTLPTKRVVSATIPRAWHHAVIHYRGLAWASVSWFEPADVGYRVLDYFKRFEETPLLTRRQRKVPLGSGRYRAWRLRWVYVPAAAVTFYGRGQLDLVRDFLGDLTHLGNDTRVGWGRIAEWRLEPIPEDRSLVHEGRAMRPIPVRFLRQWSEAVPLAWKPPYWAAESVELCAPPGATVELALPAGAPPWH